MPARPQTKYWKNVVCISEKFCFRRGQMLNISYEKTPENLFYQAVEKTVKDWPNITLVDYTATENVNASFLPG